MSVLFFEFKVQRSKLKVVGFWFQVAGFGFEVSVSAR
jgi:hypothetical protein